jgi:hypothetical protein
VSISISSLPREY